MKAALSEMRLWAIDAAETALKIAAGAIWLGIFALAGYFCLRVWGGLITAAGFA